MHQALSKAEQHEESLVLVAIDGSAADLLALPCDDRHTVLAARLEMARLMLKLAVLLDARGLT